MGLAVRVRACIIDFALSCLAKTVDSERFGCLHSSGFRQCCLAKRPNLVMLLGISEVQSREDPRASRVVASSAFAVQYDCSRPHL